MRIIRVRLDFLHVGGAGGEASLGSLLLARGIRKFVHLARVRIDDCQFVLVLRISLDPRGREAQLLPFGSMHAGLRVYERRESVILDVLRPVGLQFTFHQIVPIDIFQWVAQFRPGWHFDRVCLSSKQRAVSCQDRECDRHQEWTDRCGSVSLHQAVPHGGFQSYCNLPDVIDQAQFFSQPVLC